MTIATRLNKSCLFCLVLLVAIIACGCTGGDDGGRPTASPANESSRPALPGLILTPETPTPTSPGVTVLITPNESNARPANITSLPPVKEYLFPIEEAPQLPVQPLLVPMLIPPGFSYKGGSLDSEGVVKVQIANESEEITYIQAPRWGDPGVDLSGPGAGTRMIQSGNRTFLCSETASLHQLVWTDDAHDYYLVGGPGCGELLRMAESLAPLDYDTLDRLPYTPANPKDPFPDPERIRLIMPHSWMNARYPDKYHSRIYDITLTSTEFNASFAPDPRDSSILRHVEAKENETVVYLSLPADLFDRFSREPGQVRIRYPKDYFISFTNTESLYEAHFKDPAPPGWKARNPGIPGTTPATPVIRS